MTRRNRFFNLITRITTRLENLMTSERERAAMLEELAEDTRSADIRQHIKTHDSIRVRALKNGFGSHP